MSPAIVLAMLVGLAAGELHTVSFRDVTAQAGLVEPLAGLLGHGAAWGDFDGDGRPDLFVGGFCDRPNAEYAPASGPVPSRLFRNLGEGRFALVRPTPVEFFGRTSGALFADLDNNGSLDLYVSNSAWAEPSHRQEPQRSSQLRHCRLYRNDGGKFTDVSASSGACPDRLYKARNVGALDFDGDGLLDLLVVEDRFAPKPRSVLLRNKGGLRFEDVTRTAGLPDDLYGFGLAVADLNGDDRPDFFVPHGNHLFVSRPGGKYDEPAGLRKLFEWNPLNGEDWPCGAAFGDLNRDGRLDLVLSIHHSTARNRVYLNMGLEGGIPRFRDVTEQAGLGQTVPVRCPHVEIQDLDNDGWPDIYISAAWLDSGQVTPLVYRNRGPRDGVPRFVPPRDIRAPMVYFPAGPSADYDGDGRLDLFLVNWFAGNRCRLLHNEGPVRHWLQVRVVGKTFNRMGIGSKVWLYQAGRLGTPAALLGHQEINIGFGYASGQAAVCHFGLADQSRADVLVRLPDGKTISRTGVAADQALLLKESDDATP